MKCNNCGREINENAGFCPFCGANTDSHDIYSSSPGHKPDRVEDLTEISQDDYASKSADNTGENVKLPPANPNVGNSASDRQNSEKLKKSRKRAIVIICVITAVLICAAVAVMIFQFNRKSVNTFNFNCAQYTEQMNKILGSDTLDKNKWVKQPDKNSMRYQEKSYKIILGIGEGDKVSKITVSPSDNESGVSMAAASIMVTDSKLTQDDAMNDIAKLKDGEKRVVRDKSVITLNKKGKEVIIEPNKVKNQAPETTRAEKTADATTAAPTEAEKITDEPTTAAQTTEKPTEPQIEPWKKAYLNYLESVDSVYGNFALVKVDNDDIPELYCKASNSAPVAGSVFCWFNGENAQSSKIGASFFYQEKQGTFLDSTTMSGSRAVTVYSFSNNNLQKVNSGTRGINGKASWDDAEITPEEFDAKVESFTSVMTEPSTVSKSEIVSQIEAY